MLDNKLLDNFNLSKALSPKLAPSYMPPQLALPLARILLINTHILENVKTVRIIAKYLWGSFIMLAAMMAVAWFALHQSSSELPGQMLGKIGSHLRSNTPSISLPEFNTPKRGNPLSQPRTYYRWTDAEGKTGYSQDLPDEVRSFKVITLTGQENLLQAPRQPQQATEQAQTLPPEAAAFNAQSIEGWPPTGAFPPSGQSAQAMHYRP